MITILIIAIAPQDAAEGTAVITGDGGNVGAKGNEDEQESDGGKEDEGGEAKGFARGVLFSGTDEGAAFGSERHLRAKGGMGGN